MHRFLLHNEEIHETTERCLMAGQAGLLNGWGVFSTLRVMDGVMFEWPRHFARMQRDAQLLGVPMPEAQDLEQQLYRLVTANHASEATLRVAVVRNTGGPFDSPGQQRRFDVVAFTKDLAQWGQSARLGMVEHARHAANAFCAAKMLAWSMNLRWYELAREQGLDEVVLLNERGEVAELTSANILAVRGEEILTPPLTSGCLPGITRQVLLEIPVPGYRVREQVLTPQDLEQADELFITSSTRETLPVAEVQGLRIRFVAPSGGPGRNAAQTALAGYMKAYTRRHKLAGVVNH